MRLPIGGAQADSRTTVGGHRNISRQILDMTEQTLSMAKEESGNARPVNNIRLRYSS